MNQALDTKTVEDSEVLERAKLQEDKIIKLQALFRGYQVRKGMESQDDGMIKSNDDILNASVKEQPIN